MATGSCGPGQSRLTEQITLPEIDLVIQNTNEAPLVFDLFNNDIDFAAAQGLQEIGAPGQGLEQQVYLDLHETNLPLGKQVGIQVHVLNLVERNAASELRQPPQEPGASLAPAFEIGLRELEHKMPRQILIGV